MNKFLISILPYLKIPFLFPEIGFLDDIKYVYYFQQIINDRISHHNKSLDRIIHVLKTDKRWKKIIRILLSTPPNSLSLNECWEIKKLSKNIILHKDYVPQIHQDNIHFIEYVSSNYPDKDSINGKLCKKILEKYDGTNNPIK